MPDDAQELFDDVYLGLHAGDDARKQRSGEALSDEDREALGRWTRLSPVRKTLAVGAFTLGTFGLGFAVGGLVISRWRS